MVKENYKCSCCNGWYKKSELDHISHSTDEDSHVCQYIQCKRCKKEDLESYNYTGDLR